MDTGTSHRAAEAASLAECVSVFAEVLAATGELLAPRVLPLAWDRFRALIDAEEARFDAARIASGCSTRSVADGKRRGGNSRSTSSRKARRGSAVNNNPALGDLLGSGEASTEQIDAIAAADAASDGAASADQELIETVLGQDPDQAAKTTRDWLRDRESQDDADRRHARERRSRCVRRTRHDGIPSLLVQGDEVSIEQIWTTLEQTANAASRAAGGRDVPNDQHVPVANRMFDALHEAVTNPGESAGGVGNRPAVVFGVTVDADRDLRAELLGGGKIPTHLLEQIVCGADLFGAVFDTSGDPLWMGRAIRHASRAQWMALVARDRGCVLCGASHTRCEAHHLIPWHAPLKGETNITELALVCRECHHHIHNTNHTLHRARDGTWKLRPATPAETPPPGHKATETTDNHHPSAA